MSCRDADHCITCSDEGVAMRVLRLDEERGLALCCDSEGAHHTVETALLPPLIPGDEVLVHAGVALVALATDSRSDPGSDGLSLATDSRSDPRSDGLSP